MKTTKILFIILSFFIFSCKTAKIAQNVTYLPDNLGIQVVNSANIEENDFETFIDATKQFINTYNAEQHKFDLFYSQIDSSSIKIDIISNKYVTPGKQALGAGVTALGIVTTVALISNPEIGYVVWWYYNPHNSTVMNVALTKDIDPSMTKYARTISTRHKFQNLEKQKEKQIVGYINSLSLIMNEIENTKN
ncbi:MAG: hypothetical protein R6V23_08865 [Bacteroidales bacterium]